MVFRVGGFEEKFFEPVIFILLIGKTRWRAWKKEGG